MLINKFTNNTCHLGRLIKHHEKQKKIFFSFELTTHEDEEFYKRFVDEVKEFTPLFYALTWHNNSSMNPLTSLDSRLNFPANTLLHLVARGLTQNNATKILDRALEAGKTNIFIIRGDGPADCGQFKYAVDLIKFVSNQYNEKFCIAVAGYPDKHPESNSKVSDLHYLKLKVDAGASFVISQIVFDPALFIKFVKDCRNYGINVPIIPGIMPIYSCKSLIKMSEICRVLIPQIILDDVIKLQDNDLAIKQYGINLAAKIVENIIASGCTNGFHLFTFNRSLMTLEVCRMINNNLTIHL